MSDEIATQAKWLLGADGINFGHDHESCWVRDALVILLRDMVERRQATVQPKYSAPGRGEGK